MPRAKTKTTGPKAFFEGRIPLFYDPPSDVDLFSERWWHEVTKKDAFWEDFNHYIPDSVLKRRLKAKPSDILIVTDIEQQAERRANKKRVRDEVEIHAEGDDNEGAEVDAPQATPVPTPQAEDPTVHEDAALSTAALTSQSQHPSMGRYVVCRLCEGLFLPERTAINNRGVVICLTCVRSTQTTFEATAPPLSTTTDTLPTPAQHQVRIKQEEVEPIVVTKIESDDEDRVKPVSRRKHEGNQSRPVAVGRRTLDVADDSPHGARPIASSSVREEVSQEPVTPIRVKRARTTRTIGQ